jgi:hypothetical protein
VLNAVPDFLGRCLFCRFGVCPRVLSGRFPPSCAYALPSERCFWFLWGHSWLRLKKMTPPHGDGCNPQMHEPLGDRGRTRTQMLRHPLVCDLFWPTMCFTNKLGDCPRVCSKRPQVELPKDFGFLIAGSVTDQRLGISSSLMTLAS